MKLKKKAGTLFIVGMAFIAAAGFLLFIAWNMLFVLVGQNKRCTYKTTALVDDIVVYNSRDPDESDDTYAYFSYNYNGTPYHEHQSIQNISMVSEGDEVTIYLDPDNPEDFYYRKGTTGDWIVFLIFALAGGVFGFTGVHSIMEMFEKREKK